MKQHLLNDFKSKRKGRLVECKWCGKKIYRKPSKIKINMFCSMKCQGKWQSAVRCGESASNWKGGKIKVICAQCNKEIYIKQYRFKENKKYFCSSKCMGKWQAENTAGTNSPCWDSVKIKCKYCGEEFYKPAGQIKKYNFCSNKCLGKYQTGKNAPNWQGGLSFGKYCNKFNEYLKENIRKEFNRQCFLCGKPESKRKLSVHHIDYNKMQGCETEWQLVPLCGSCHQMTNGKHVRDHYEWFLSTLLHIRKMIFEYEGNIDYRSL